MVGCRPPTHTSNAPGCHVHPARPSGTTTDKDRERAVSTTVAVAPGARTPVRPYASSSSRGDALVATEAGRRPQRKATSSADTVLPTLVLRSGTTAEYCNSQPPIKDSGARQIQPKQSTPPPPFFSSSSFFSFFDVHDMHHRDAPWCEPASCTYTRARTQACTLFTLDTYTVKDAWKVPHCCTVTTPVVPGLPTGLEPPGASLDGSGGSAATARSAYMKCV